VAEVVPNTSPLSYLHRLGRLELLRDLFGKVLVPAVVVKELSRGRTLGYDLPNPQVLPWVEIREAPDAEYEGLGVGETGVLNLARTLTDPLVILDDGAARAWAMRLGFRLTGTLGVFVEAKMRGLVTTVRPEIDRLQGLGFRLTPEIRAAVLRSCDEA
jgi:uncharacterized protein